MTMVKNVIIPKLMSMLRNADIDNFSECRIWSVSNAMAIQSLFTMATDSTINTLHSYAKVWLPPRKALLAPLVAI